MSLVKFIHTVYAGDFKMFIFNRLLCTYSFTFRADPSSTLSFGGGRIWFFLSVPLFLFIFYYLLFLYGRAVKKQFVQNGRMLMLNPVTRCSCFQRTFCVCCADISEMTGVQNVWRCDHFLNKQWNLTPNLLSWVRWPTNIIIYVAQYIYRKYHIFIDYNIVYIYNNINNCSE